jgi:hypothetical protein
MKSQQCFFNRVIITFTQHIMQLHLFFVQSIIKWCTYFLAEKNGARIED